MATSKIPAKVKSKTFTLHTDATWGTMAVPSDVPKDRITNAYLTGAYSYFALTVRGDGLMFAWYFDNNGTPAILRNADVSGVINYLD